MRNKTLSNRFAAAALAACLAASALTGCQGGSKAETSAAQETTVEETTETAAESTEAGTAAESSDTVTVTDMAGRTVTLPSEIKSIATFGSIGVINLVIIGAGSSKGTKDYTMDVLETLGTVIVQELGVAPGKHCSLTMAGHIPVLGIPGPPGGARLITRYYAKAAVDLLYTGQILPPESVSAILDENVSPKWIDFMQPVSLYEKDGILYAHPEKSFGLTWTQSLRCSHSYFYCQRKTAYQKGLRILAETPL